MDETEAPTPLDRVVDAVAPDATLRAPVPSVRRRRAFDNLIAKLAPTDLGRRLGLSRLNSFADLRATIPVYRADEHLVKIEAALGFGPALGSSTRVDDPGEAERDELISRWTAFLKARGRGIPRRCFRLGVEPEPALARWERGDFAALMGPEGEFKALRSQDPAECLALMQAAEPDALVAPSLASVAWLESHGRARIEALVPSLKMLFAQHDLDEAVRSRLPVVPQGLSHPAGRLTLPVRAHGEEAASGRIAWSSCLIELLREDESTRHVMRPATAGARRREDRRAVGPGAGARAPLASHGPVLPEHAVLGERYELVLSSATGFLRMRSGIYGRLVGFEVVRDATRLVPVPTLIPLPPPPDEFALEGVRMPGATLTAALRQAFDREDPALVAAEIGGALRPDPGLDLSARSPTDSGFFGATELGSLDLARRGRRPLGLELRVEVQGTSRGDFAARLAARYDSILRRRSAAYDYLRTRRELFEPTVLIVAGGTERRARSRRASNFRGTVARPQIRVADGS